MGTVYVLNISDIQTIWKTMLLFCALQITANSPFNVSDWGGERLKDDIRWKYGVPPVNNANYAWLQHMLHHLNPTNGVAGTVLANGSLSAQSAGEGDIRMNMIKDDVIECIVSLPAQLFYSVAIPVSLWIMRKEKNTNTKGKTLFIDAKKLGYIQGKLRKTYYGVSYVPPFQKGFLHGIIMSKPAKCRNTRDRKSMTKQRKCFIILK